MSTMRELKVQAEAQKTLIGALEADLLNSKTDEEEDRAYRGIQLMLERYGKTMLEIERLHAKEQRIPLLKRIFKK